MLAVKAVSASLRCFLLDQQYMEMALSGRYKDPTRRVFSKPTKLVTGPIKPVTMKLRA